MGEPQLLLTGPPAPLVDCPTCGGTGRARLNAVMVARECPTCRGVGTVGEVAGFRDAFDLRVYELGLRSRP